MTFVIFNASVFPKTNHLKNSTKRLQRNLKTKLDDMKNKKCVNNYKDKECIILFDEIEELSSTIHKLKTNQQD